MQFVLRDWNNGVSGGRLETLASSKQLPVHISRMVLFVLNPVAE